MGWNHQLVLFGFGLEKCSSAYWFQTVFFFCWLPWSIRACTKICIPTPRLTAGLDRFKPHCKATTTWTPQPPPPELWNLVILQHLSNIKHALRAMSLGIKKGSFGVSLPKKNTRKTQRQKLNQLSKSHSSKMINLGGTLGSNYCNMQQVIYSTANLSICLILIIN